MSDVLREIDEFRAYAAQRLSAGERRSFEELFDEWRDQGVTPEDEEADLLAVEEALRDYDAGDRGRPYEEVMAELRRKHRLSRASFACD